MIPEITSKNVDLELYWLLAKETYNSKDKKIVYLENNTEGYLPEDNNYEDLIKRLNDNNNETKN